MQLYMCKICMYCHFCIFHFKTFHVLTILSPTEIKYSYFRGSTTFLWKKLSHCKVFDTIFKKEDKYHTIGSQYSIGPIA